MGRGQKRVLVVSVILVLALALALGCFLYLEHKKDAELSEGSEANQQEQPGSEENPAEEEGAEDPLGQEAAANREPSGQEGPEGTPETPAEGPEQIEPVTLFFAGDIMLAGNSVRANYDSSGINGILSDYLLAEMQQADVTMVNQEFPFSTRGTQAPDKEYTFRADPSYVNAFLDMGVDAVSLANNHALDYGTEALEDTFVTLDEAGIPYAGAGATKERAAQPIYLECKGRTIGLLAASRVIPVVSWNIENQQPGMLCTYDSGKLVEAIQATRPNCDYLAVFVHWGVEYQNTPEEYQRQLARNYIDAGADLVVGSHSHVPQGIEYYNGKPVVYGLGNYIFNRNDRDAYALKVVLTPEDATELQVIPVKAVEAKTSEQTGEAKQSVLDLIQRVSSGIAVDGEGRIRRTEEETQ